MAERPEEVTTPHSQAKSDQPAARTGHRQADTDAAFTEAAARGVSASPASSAAPTSGARSAADGGLPPRRQTHGGKAQGSAKPAAAKLPADEANAAAAKPSSAAQAEAPAPASASASAAKPAAAAGAGKPKAGGGKKSKRTWRDTRAGRLLELLAYLIMLVLVLVYFTGKGLFIYEGF
ncbi:hypothetical protein ACFFK0_01105 [Paenibacillus chartarius]|uniref:Uncharacterized protein n=1 Tax=Paenibacillus chartarius TaxID=747481 RepID=A0ABV6DEM5_9BACL